MFKKAGLFLALIGIIAILSIIACLLFVKFAPVSDSRIQVNVQYFYNKPSQIPSEVKIKIIKSNRALELYGGGVMIGRFKVGLGYASSGDKIKEGDGQTPIGKFYICTRVQSQYKYFLGISYPNKADAKRGLNDGLISQDEFDKIYQSIDAKEKPPWNTKLGGAIGLHGSNDSADWTAGCIALSEAGIDAIWAYAKMGTPVEIVV